MNNATQPNIIKEVYGGISSYSIEDDMLQRRELSCVDEINVATVNSLISQILYLEHSDPEGEVTIYINCPGGEVSSGLALLDVMKAVSCPIRTVCVGMAASMGAVLFAAGDRRDLLPHARVMIHDPGTYGAGGSALQVKNLSEDLMRTREIIAEILAEATGRPIEEIYEKSSQDSYFYADEAIEFGLADHIIDSL